MPFAVTNNHTSNRQNTFLNTFATVIDNDPSAGALHGSAGTITICFDNSTLFAGL